MKVYYLILRKINNCFPYTSKIFINRHMLFFLCVWKKNYCHGNIKIDQIMNLYTLIIYLKWKVYCNNLH